MSFEEYLLKLKKIFVLHQVGLVSTDPEENPEYPFTGGAKQHWEVLAKTIGSESAEDMQARLNRFRMLFEDNQGFRVSFYESLPRLVERLPTEKNVLVLAVIKLRLDNGFSL